MTITEENASLTVETETPAPVVTSLILPAEYALRAFRAALVAASKDPARPILEAVFVTVADGMAEIAATDSYRLVTVQFKAPDSPDGSILLSRDVVVTLTKAYTKSAIGKLFTGHILVISANDRDASLEIVHPTGTTVDPSGHVDGTYPNYQTLMPTEDAIGFPMVAYNPKFLADVGKVAAEIVASEATPVRHETWTAGKPARFTIKAEDDSLTAVYLLMPVRVS